MIPAHEWTATVLATLQPGEWTYTIEKDASCGSHALEVRGVTPRGVEVGLRRAALEVAALRVAPAVEIMMLREDARMTARRSGFSGEPVDPVEPPGGPMVPLAVATPTHEDTPVQLDPAAIESAAAWFKALPPPVSPQWTATCGLCGQELPEPCPTSCPGCGVIFAKRGVEHARQVVARRPSEPDPPPGLWSSGGRMP